MMRLVFRDDGSLAELHPEGQGPAPKGAVDIWPSGVLAARLQQAASEGRLTYKDGLLVDGQPLQMHTASDLRKKVQGGVTVAAVLDDLLTALTDAGVLDE